MLNSKIQASSKPKGSKSHKLQEPRTNSLQTNALKPALILVDMPVEPSQKHAALARIIAQEVLSNHA